MDMYKNNITTEICLKADKLCGIVLFSPNPCCKYINANRTNPCGTNTTCWNWSENYWKWEKPGLLRNFTLMLIQFLVQFTIIFIYETGFIRKVVYMLRKLTNKKKINEKMGPTTY